MYIKNKDPEIKGFNANNMWRMKKFYEIYSKNEKLAAVRQVLSWTHHKELLSKCKSLEEHEFYAISNAKSNWSTRELVRQIISGSFERTLLADSKLSTVSTVLKQDIKSIFKDSYLIDFAGLSEPHKESDLQRAIVNNLKSFLLELGSGFTFVGEKIRLSVGNSDFELDLLFYHRELQSLVAFELKKGDFNPRDLGQLSFYLEALDRQYKLPHENPSIGVLLCRSKDDEVVEFALSGVSNPALVAEYETKLIPKELLRLKLNEWYNYLETCGE